MAARGRGRSRGSLNPKPNIVNGSSLERPGSSTRLAQEMPVAPATAVAVEGQFADVQPVPMARTQQLEMGDTVTVQVSSLPLGTTTDDIKSYLQGLGDDVDILSAEDMGDGSVQIKVAGYTAEELERIKKKKHKLNKQKFEIALIVPTDEPLQPLEFNTHSESGNIIPNVLEITGFPPGNIDTERLQIYLENTRSGGRPDAVVECSIISQNPGIVHVQFQSQEVAAHILSKKDHTLQGSPLHFHYVQKVKDEPTETNKLLISNLSPDVDLDLMQLFLENVLEMKGSEFSVENLPDETILVTFSSDYTSKELTEMITKIESKSLKKAYLKAELCRVSRSITVSNISKHYDEEFLTLYFDNPGQSGGRDVESVECLGDGEAVITFKDPKVLKDVLARTHTTRLGENIIVSRTLFCSKFGAVSTSTISAACSLKLPTHTTLEPFEHQIDPLIAKYMQKYPEGFAICMQNLCIQQPPQINEKKGIITIIPTNQARLGWQQEFQKQLSSYVSSNVTKVEVRIPQEAETEVMRHLVTIQDKGPIVFELYQNHTGFTAAGSPDIMNMLQGKMKDITSAHEQAQDKVQLNPEDYTYVSQVKSQQIKEAHPNLRIECNPSDFSFLIQGSVQDVNNFKQLLPEHANHVSIPVQDIIHPIIIQYLFTEDGRQQLNEFIQKKCIPLTVCFKRTPHNGVALYILCDPANADSVRAVAGALQEATSKQVHQLPRMFTSLPPADINEYYQLCQSLEKQEPVRIETSESDFHVSIAGFSSGVTKSSQTLLRLVNEKCTIEKPIVLEKGIWNLLCGPMQAKWDSMVLQCKQKEVDLISPAKAAISPQIILKGSTEQVQDMYKAIIMLMESVTTRPILISRPGTCIYFKENEKVKWMISGIEKEYQVCIEIKEVDDEINDGCDYTQSKSSPHFTKLCVAHTKELKQIIIYVGNIAEFTRAEVVVNAANCDLKHSGGVAKALVKKGGPVIQEESLQYIKSHGKLDDGDAWLTTTVGKLPCKALIHAVGPKWKGGDDKEAAHLSKACAKSMEHAQNYRSIAFPAISSGIYDFPIDQCADVLVQAVVHFSKYNRLADLQEINFVLIKESDAHSFVNAVRRYLPAENIVTEELNSPSSLTTYNPGVSVSCLLPETKKKSKKTKSSKFVPQCIQLHKGSILTVKADVYVNTSNPDLNLSQGAVAQALSAAAGPTLQAECNKKKVPISYGDIVVTRAGNLTSTQYVFHTVLSNHDGPGGRAEKELQQVMQKCLKECMKLKISSIAFPALGAGNLNFPSDTVAKIMVGELSNFFAMNKNTSLIAAHLVIFMEDTYQAFQQEIARCKLPIPSSDGQPSPKLSKAKFARPEMNIDIMYGDITDSSSDAIVTTTNPQLQLHSAGEVAGALLRKGGQELQRHCDTLRLQGHLSQLEGKVLCTPATGLLKCQSVFHIYLKIKGRDDTHKLGKAVTACLQKAEELKYNSIAFPAIGVGFGCFATEAIAKAMMKAIQQFRPSKNTPRHLTSVHIVLFDHNTCQSFITLFKEAEVSQPGWGQSIKSFVEHYVTLPSWSSTQSESDSSNVAVTTSSSPEYEEKMYKKLELKIYGESTDSVKQAESRLYKIIDDQFITDRIDNASIEYLPRSETAKLEALSREMHVEMEINRAPLNYIRLKGDRAEVQQLKVHIVQTLSSFEKYESRQREIEHIQKLVQWKWLDFQETEYVDYDVLVNYEIEQAFLRNDPTYTHKIASEHYTINFKDMKELDHSNGDTTKVLRVDLERQFREGERPLKWDPMPVDSNSMELPVVLIKLDSQSEEYKNVETEFNKTMRSGADYNKIIKIERVQNPMQYGQYQVKKKEMDKRNPPTHCNENLLWHGTSATTCPKINSQSFNRNFAGQHATAYGRGVYFAQHAKYSARDIYTPRDLNGYKYMYYVRVLTGEYTVGNSSMLVPPPKDPSKDPNILFDSVVNSLHDPQIFVVFHDAHAYPEYLVVFE